MTEVVDSIVAELIVRDNGYLAGLDKAIAKHKEYRKSAEQDLGAVSIEQTLARASAAAVKAAETGATAEEQATTKITRTRKARSDASIAEDTRAALSAKRTADARIAEAGRVAAREAQLDANAARRTIGSTGAVPLSGLNRLPNNDLSRGARGTAGPNLDGEAEVASQKELNQLGIDYAITADLARVSHGKDAEVLADLAGEMRLVTSLQAKGADAQTISLALSERQLAVEAARADQAKAQAAKGDAKGLEQFARGSGFYAATGGAFAVAGIATAAAVGAGIEAIKDATEYAKALHDVATEAGLSTDKLQVYQAAATQAGVSQQQFATALGMLSDNLGKARTGSVVQAKDFAALGVNINTAASAGDLLPTLIARISSIADPAKRARIEMALFGETGEKLDGLLAGGNQKVNDLAAALQRTGAILSSSDIAKLDEVSKQLDVLKAQLLVDVSTVVAHNSDSILSLAQSFATLANDIGGAIEKYKAFASSDFGRELAAVSPVRAGAEASAGIFDDETRLGVTAHIRSHFPTIAKLFGFGSDAEDRSKAADATDAKLTASLAGADKGSSFLQSLKGAGVQPGAVNNKLLDSLGAPKGPKGKSADQLQKEAAERQIALIERQAKEQETRLGLLSDLTANTDEQDRIQKQVIDIERKAANDVLSQQGPKGTKKYTDAEVSRLQGLNDQNAVLKDQLVDQKEVARHIVESVTKAQTLADIQTALLDNQSAIADTARQRRAIETRLLAIAAEQERIGLQAIVNDKTKTPQEQANAQAQLNALPTITAGKQAAIDRQNESPAQAYTRSLNPTGDQKQELIEDDAVKTLESFNTALDKSVESALHLHGIFGEIVGDLVDMLIKQSLLKPLVNGLSGGTGTGFLGTIGAALGFGGNTSALASVAGGTGGVDSLVGLAGGGSFVVGGNGGIDQNVLSINGEPTIRVNNGETIAVIPPNVAASNQRVYPQSSTTVVHQHINVDGRNSVTPADFAGQIIAVANDHANRVAAASGQKAVAAAPGRVQRAQTLGS